MEGLPLHGDVEAQLRSNFFSAIELEIIHIRSRRGRTDRRLEALIFRVGNMRSLQLITQEEAKNIQKRANQALLFGQER